MTGATPPTARGIIADLYAYGAWASERLLACAERLPDAELRRVLSAGALPILESFTHLVSSDRRWLARCQGAAMPPRLTPADLPTIAAVRRAADELVEARRRYIDGLDDAALGAPIRWQDDGETRTLSRWQGLVQSANHGMQHRSEIAAMLTDLGHSPGDLDFGLWCRTARR